MTVGVVAVFITNKNAITTDSKHVADQLKFWGLIFKKYHKNSPRYYKRLAGTCRFISAYAMSRANDYKKHLAEANIRLPNNNLNDNNGALEQLFIDLVMFDYFCEGKLSAWIKQSPQLNLLPVELEKKMRQYIGLSMGRNTTSPFFDVLGCLHYAQSKKLDGFFRLWINDYELVRDSIIADCRFYAYTDQPE